VKDAAGIGVGEGDVVRVESRRGALEGRARITGVRPGVVFVPFHYGDWGTSTPGERSDASEGRHRRAANELTVTAWDPVSKQPICKVAAVRVTKVADGSGQPSPAPTVGARPHRSTPPRSPPTVGGPAAEATATSKA
jgi:predicted molibdopterin-dependent oxidoreductase YjgC